MVSMNGLTVNVSVTNRVTTLGYNPIKCSKSKIGKLIFGLMSAHHLPFLALEVEQVVAWATPTKSGKRHTHFVESPTQYALSMTHKEPCPNIAKSLARFVDENFCLIN